MFLILFGGVLSIFRVHANFTSLEPIVHWVADCPATHSGAPRIHLKTDVLASATVSCKNGKKDLLQTSDVEYMLDGRFEQSYVGADCLFFKKKGSNSYTVDLEAGWGERGSTVYKEKETYTVTCAYDAHGDALSKKKQIRRSYLAPDESQRLVGLVDKTARFKMAVVSVIGKKIVHPSITIGKKIRLRIRETSGTVKSFRVISCDATNSVVRYGVLRAGCGDGVVFKRKKGFRSKGSKAVSPFFTAFRLKGPNEIKFECNFTICERECDGDSCSTVRRRRSEKQIVRQLAEHATAQKVERFYQVVPMDVIRIEDDDEVNASVLATDTQTETSLLSHIRRHRSRNW